MKLAPSLRDKMTFCYQSYQRGFLPGAERELGLYLIHSTHPAAAAAVSMSCPGLGSLAEWLTDWLPDLLARHRFRHGSAAGECNEATAREKEREREFAQKAQAVEGDGKT